MASAKPNAIALTGRNGLAVTAPKATAIAGISPKEAAAFTIQTTNRPQSTLRRQPPEVQKPLSLSTLQTAPDYSYNFVEFSPVSLQDNLRQTSLTSQSDHVQPLMGSTSAIDSVMQAWNSILFAAQHSERLPEDVTDSTVTKAAKAAILESL